MDTEVPSPDQAPVRRRTLVVAKVNYSVWEELNNKWGIWACRLCGAFGSELTPDQAMVTVASHVREKHPQVSFRGMLDNERGKNAKRKS